MRLFGRLVGGALLLVYLIASRSLVVLLALYLVIYFLLSSRPVKDLIQQAISDAIPGSIGACAVQWGPLPWHVRIAEGRVVGARGEEVIRVRGVEATIDLGRTLDDLVAFISDGSRPFKVHLERVDLLEPWARVEVHDDGWVGMEHAFVDPDAPSEPEAPDATPFQFELDAAVVRVLDGGTWVEAPGFHLRARGVDAVTNYAMVIGPGAPGGHGFHMAFDIPRTDVPEAELQFTFFDHMPEPLTVDARHLMVEDFAWRGLGFQWRAAVGELGGAAHARFEGTGGLDAAPAIPTWHGAGSVAFTDAAPEVRALTRDLFRGPLDVAIGGGGDVEQLRASWSMASPELAIDTILYHQLEARGRIEPRGTPAVPDRHALFIDEAAADVGGGRATITSLAWDPRLDDADARDLSFAVHAEDVDVPSALAALFGEAMPRLPDGRWNGDATIALSPRPEVGGDVMTVEVDRADVTWAAADALPAGLPGSWRVSGRVTRATGLSEMPRGGGLAPFDRLDLRGLVLDAGDDRVRLAGTIDLMTGDLDLEPYARIGDLAPVARGLGLGDLGGRLVLKAARARGTLRDPRVEGTVNWTGARIGARELGRVQGQIVLQNGELALRDATSEGPVVGFALDVALGLFDPAALVPEGAALPWALRPDPRFKVKTRRLQGFAAAALGPWLGPDARIAVEQGAVEGSLSDPLASLEGGGRVTITNASFAGETGVRIDGTVRADKAGRGAIALEDAVVTFQSGAVWTGRVKLGGRAGGTRGAGGAAAQTTLEGALEIGDTSLANLRPVAVALPDLSAILRGHLTLGGTLARPVFIGTLELEDTIVGGVRLGDAALAVTTHDKVVEISAFDDQLFGGFRLERANLTLDGFAPRRFEAAVVAVDKDLGDLVPELADSALDLVGSATAEIEIDVPSDAMSFRVKARPHDLTLSVPGKNVRWTNDTELLLISDAGRFRLHPVTLAPTAAVIAGLGPGDPRLEACGKVDAEQLDLQLSGAIDLAVVPGLADLFSVAEGRLSIAPDATASARIGDETCLQNASALLLLRGPVTAPVAVGRVALEDVALVPRGSGRELRLRDGTTVQLRQGDGRGVQRLLIGGEVGRFEGDLDDGTFGLKGEIDFHALRPRSIDVDIVGADLFIQSAGEFAFTASPNAHLLATGLDGASPQLSLSGDLALSEGRFSKSFDTFARAVGGALGVKSDVYTTSILDEVPWLGETKLAINVVASDFQIQSALPLARTDLPARLDLTLRGTIAEPRLYRRIDLLPGGTLTYLVFERTFTVSQGAVDFDGDPERPLVEVTAQTAITYLQRAQTALQEEDEKEVAVTLRMSGRVPDLKIELSSDDPTLDQADIQSLLITGKPRGDLDRAQQSRVVSADLAGFINAVLSAPFVRTASVGLDQKGGLEYRVGTCFAPNLCFDTTTVSDDTETTLRAKFSLSIGDDVVCEGTLKRSDTGATTTSQETYEARCRYRIPLE